jgi:hypothetical protein
VSLGPLAVVLLLPVALVVGLRTRRWTRVVVAGLGAALAALIFPTAAVIIVVAGVLALIAGAVLLGTGAHAVGRPGGTLSVAELVVGGLAIRWWRRRQVRRWTDSWPRRARQQKL